MNRIIIAGSNQAIYPGKIMCVGRNYLRHIEELGNPVPDDMVLFMKPNSAIGQAIKTFPENEIHYEAEICFLVRGGRFYAAAAGLDLTKRDVQNRLKSKGLPWERAKAFDGAALFTEFVEIDEIARDLEVRLSINGQTVQSGGVTSMIYSPQEILDECRRFVTLEDNDVIMSGTPEGVGPVMAGDRYDLSLLAGGQVLISDSWVVVEGG